MKRICSIVVVLFMLIGLFSGPIHALEITASAKIDSNLRTAISESADKTAQAYITMDHVTDESILALFQQRYPTEYKAYMYAKYDEIGNMTAEEIAAMDDELLQRAIERKREIAKELYAKANRDTVEQYFDDGEILFVSSYAPVAIVETDSTSVALAARCSNVVSIDAYTEMDSVSAGETAEMSESGTNTSLYDSIMEDLDLANQISRADLVRDEKGCTGEDAIIGVIEAKGVPDLSNPYLSSADITIRAGDTGVSDHATTVLSILVATEADGTAHGIVPDAAIYCCSISDTTTFLQGVEWLIDSGVNIINASLNFSSSEGYYDNICAWVDHLAIQHDVHFVATAGEGSIYVQSPGMAYNAITVGNFIANGSDDITGFVFDQDSSYGERHRIGEETPEKPNLIANGCFENACAANGVLSHVSGTGFAAPQVAGVIAQLCDYSSKLKTKQTQVGAMLAASAAEKVEATGTGEKGDTFTLGWRVENITQLGEREGAGILDSRWAWGIAANHNHWSYNVASGGFPFTQTITIDTSKNSLTRVAIFWLKRNQVNNHTGISTASNPTLPNLTLYVYAPDGTLLGKSDATFANFEIVQFAPPATGEYRIVITCSTTTTTTTNVGISVW